jgi:hypothetical protein
MDNDKIVLWATKAQMDASSADENCRVPHFDDVTLEELEAFAKLVADAEAKRMQDEGMVTVGHMREQVAKEREACAAECERMIMYPGGRQVSAAHQNVWAAAKAIRERGQ